MSNTGTIDNPVKTTVPAGHYTTADGGIPSLVVDIDLSSLGVGTRYEYDCVLHVEDKTVTLLFVPSEDDEGWERLDEVGEW
jgi:hypothetical protein